MNNLKKLPLWAALTSYLMGLLWICCFFAGFWDPGIEWPYMHLYPLLFALVFFPWAGRSLREKHGCREHLFWMACTLLIALAIACKRVRAVVPWAYIVLHGFAAYWVLCRSGCLTDGETGSFLPLDLLNAGVLAPFGGFFLRIQTLFCRCCAFFAGRKSVSAGSRKNALMSVLVILAALPALMLAGNLLGQADETFQSLLTRIGAFLSFTWTSPRWMEEYFLRFLFGLPVGAYLFGLVGGSLRREKPPFDAGTIRTGLKHLAVAPAAALTAVLCSFCALYLLFFAVQVRHLLGAFVGNVPGTLTAAQYARSGFFQLCLVMAINFGLLGASMLVSRTPFREHRALRICGNVLMVQSIFLAVTAASKLALYIHRFGFTPLRLLSSWGVLVLTAGCLLALWSLRVGRKVLKYWTYFSAATFTLLCFY